jgi:hypothetical protein
MAGDLSSPVLDMVGYIVTGLVMDGVFSVLWWVSCIYDVASFTRVDGKAV